MALKYRRLWLVAGFGFVLLVFYLSLTSDKPDLPGGPKAWKVGHVMAYAWLMLWYAQIYPALSTRVLIGSLFCLMGIGIEYLQGMTDYRTFAYTDMLLDAFGVSIGFALGYTPLQHALRMLERLVPQRV